MEPSGTARHAVTAGMIPAVLATSHPTRPAGAPATSAAAPTAIAASTFPANPWGAPASPAGLPTPPQLAQAASTSGLPTPPQLAQAAQAKPWLAPTQLQVVQQLGQPQTPPFQPRFDAGPAHQPPRFDPVVSVPRFQPHQQQQPHHQQQFPPQRQSPALPPTASHAQPPAPGSFQPAPFGLLFQTTAFAAQTQQAQDQRAAQTAAVPSASERLAGTPHLATGGASVDGGSGSDGDGGSGGEGGSDAGGGSDGEGDSDVGEGTSAPVSHAISARNAATAPISPVSGGDDLSIAELKAALAASQADLAASKAALAASQADLAASQADMAASQAAAEQAEEDWALRVEEALAQVYALQVKLQTAEEAVCVAQQDADEAAEAAAEATAAVRERDSELAHLRQARGDAAFSGAAAPERLHSKAEAVMKAARRWLSGSLDVGEVPPGATAHADVLHALDAHVLALMAAHGGPDAEGLKAFAIDAAAALGDDADACAQASESPSTLPRRVIAAWLLVLMRAGVAAGQHMYWSRVAGSLASLAGLPDAACATLRGQTGTTAADHVDPRLLAPPPPPPPPTAQSGGKGGGGLDAQAAALLCAVESSNEAALMVRAIVHGLALGSVGDKAGLQQFHAAADALAGVAPQVIARLAKAAAVEADDAGVPPAAASTGLTGDDSAAAGGDGSCGLWVRGAFPEGLRHVLALCAELGCRAALEYKESLGVTAYSPTPEAVWWAERVPGGRLSVSLDGAHAAGAPSPLAPPFLVLHAVATAQAAVEAAAAGGAGSRPAAVVDTARAAADAALQMLRLADTPCFLPVGTPAALAVTPEVRDFVAAGPQSGGDGVTTWCTPEGLRSIEKRRGPRVELGRDELLVGVGLAVARHRSGEGTQVVLRAHLLALSAVADELYVPQ